jgi:spore coat polysaccharide biosynthesis protein SpsF
MNKRTLVILQARMSSSRLPGKVMMRINGRPMIYWQIQRILKASKINDLVIATSNDSTDDSLVEFLRENSFFVHRGSMNNVLSRFVEIASKSPSDAYVRLTGDCPLVMPNLIDEMVDDFYERNVEYLSNTLVPTFPDGLDIEIFNDGALQKLSRLNLTNEELEHVTYGIHSRPGIFQVSNYMGQADHSSERWTVDYQEDFDFIKEVYEAFSGREAEFSYEEVLDFIAAVPSQKSHKNKFKRNEQLKRKNHG